MNTVYDLSNEGTMAMIWIDYAGLMDEGHKFDSSQCHLLIVIQFVTTPDQLKPAVDTHTHTRHMIRSTFNTETLRFDRQINGMDKWIEVRMGTAPVSCVNMFRKQWTCLLCEIV